ncbi:MAG: permease [Firmicutes bacterium]|nr:permease [Bacillota bacterium]
MSRLARYRFPIFMLLLSACVSLAMPHKAGAILSNTLGNFAEMLSIIPPIFLLLGLMDVWVPRETFVKYMGDRSGIVGIALAVFIGAFAAGPLYGAFPVASMMLRKGASFYNVMVLLGAWSTLKIPMFLFETASLGARFSVTRWTTNIPVILVISRLITAMLGQEEVDSITRKQYEMEKEGPGRPGRGR